jgi:hypothetical protein
MKLASLASYANDHLPEQFTLSLRLDGDYFGASIYYNEDCNLRIIKSWHVIPAWELIDTVRKIKQLIAALSA